MDSVFPKMFSEIFGRDIQKSDNQIAEKDRILIHNMAYLIGKEVLLPGEDYGSHGDEGIYYDFFPKPGEGVFSIAFNEIQLKKAHEQRPAMLSEIASAQVDKVKKLLDLKPKNCDGLYWIKALAVTDWVDFNSVGSDEEILKITTEEDDSLDNKEFNARALKLMKNFDKIVNTKITGGQKLF